MTYVDGFLVPVPKKRIGEYKKIAKLASKVWKDHGALEVIEAVADDVKKGKWTSFPRAVKLKPSETVVFSFIVYKSKAHRNKVNAKVMKDPGMNEMPKEMPFDFKRMCYGGFKAIVED